MIEYRMACPQEEEQLLDLIDLVFSQVRVPHDFAQLLPKVYAHDGFSAYHAVAVEDGRIRATIAMLPQNLRVDEAHILKTGYLGSVATHGKSRGKGYMKHLIEMQIDRAREQGFDLLALGGQRQRYGHYGFEDGCAQAEITVTARNVRLALGDVAEDVRACPITEADEALLQAAWTLSEGQTMTCIRPRERFSDVMRTYRGQLYALLRGDEFIGYLHALGDDVTELALIREADIDAAVKAWLKNRDSARFIVPLHRRERFRALQRYAENVDLTDSQMLLILRWQPVLSACFDLACKNRPLPEGSVTVEIAGEGTFRITVRDGKSEVAADPGPADIRLTPQEAVSVFFSVASPFLLDGHPLLRSWLPLSLSMPVPDHF